jgi:hypothetical protein
MDKMLALLPVLEAPGFSPSVWPDRKTKLADGTEVEHLPYPEYHPAIQRLRELSYTTSCYTDAYDVLPEDPPRIHTAAQSSDGMAATKFLEGRNPFKTATLAQVRRYFCLILRAERFCDGYIGAQFDKGWLVAALRRLQALRSQMGA